MKLKSSCHALYAGLLVLGSLPLSAAETVKYTYDAKGRLVKVERSGTANDQAKTEYEIDKANNRKRVKTTNAPS
ncbi:hypothetical protein HME9302_00096 [Alteripontixanthobacter maritimus]|uniref:YD repeat-containing protein n=1 Tax=Alteripontixanthobacter maritimus TaxID=2161824 RepID=A0A369Q378_9SPHN|nr:hypothetical protein [Alteripontixanthobacter maritimus]RDC58920.1 hypothetical protein HME9302_00096 [Alteripontixanthobacter maritimus]